MNRESDGERAVRVALDHLGIKYEQEKEITFLKGDYHGVRRADFFLPYYNIYLEYLGGWDKKNTSERIKEQKRYTDKMESYKLNKLKVIYIYPKELNYLTSAIRRGLEKLGNKVEPLPFYKNNLTLSVITAAIIFLVLSFLVSKFYIILFILSIVTLFVFNSIKCPNCKRLFKTEHVNRHFDRIENRSWEYRIETRYLYSDGTRKNSTYSDWKKRIEKIKIFKNIKECKACSYKWSEQEEENLDEETRPETLFTVQTGYRNPLAKILKRI
jgi:hypothetical protein